MTFMIFRQKDKKNYYATNLEIFLKKIKLKIKKLIIP